jgi:hypothetical protein
MELIDLENKLLLYQNVSLNYILYFYKKILFIGKRQKAL